MTKFKLLINKLNIIFALFFIVFSCSFNENNSTKYDVLNGSYNNLVLSKKSFDNIGFKFSKEYDVKDLPDALSAFYGFWGPNSFDRLSYELRFYPSHQTAKSSGVIYAEEVTGSDAILKKSEASWKEGIKDRSGTTFTGTNMPKYLDYVVFGNMIILCPSEKSSAVTGVSDPIINCKNLLNEVIKFLE